MPMNTNPAPQSLGRTAFEAYRANRSGLNHDGSQTPPWEKLTDSVCAGWEAAGAAVEALLAARAQDKIPTLPEVEDEPAPESQP